MPSSTTLSPKVATGTSEPAAIKAQEEIATIKAQEEKAKQEASEMCSNWDIMKEVSKLEAMPKEELEAVTRKYWGMSELVGGGRNGLEWIRRYEEGSDSEETDNGSDLEDASVAAASGTAAISLDNTTSTMAPSTIQAIHIPAFLTPSTPFTALHPTSLPLPAANQSQLLIKVTHLALQQVDLLYARGAHQNNNAKRGHVHPPFTLGLDFAGFVAPCPAALTPFTPGTRVFGTHPGAFATYLLAPRQALHVIPRGLSAAHAAALAGGAVSFAAVRDYYDVRAAGSVLVTGAPGHLALVAAQVARARGARVWLLARDEGRAAATRRALGPGDEGMVVLAAAGGRWREQVLEATGGKGVELVVDNVGMVEDGLRVLRYGGTVVLVGFAGREAGDVERLPMNRVLLKGAKLVGFRFGEAVRQGSLDLERCWEEYLDCLDKGQVKAVVDPTRFAGLQAVGQAMELLAQGKLVGKAVIEIASADHTSRL